MAKNKKAKMAKNKKAKKAKNGKSGMAKKLQAKGKDVTEKIKSPYGHLLNKQSGFIDVYVALGMSIPTIEKKWTQAHPGNPMKPGRVKAHLHHLIEKHGFSKDKAAKMLKS